MRQHIRKGLNAAALIIVAAGISGCNGGASRDRGTDDRLPDDQRLTLEAIFEDDAYESESPKRVQWLEDGSGYTVVEDVDPDAAADEDSDEEVPQHIVFYDPETLESRIMVTAAELTPEGREGPLSVDDYAWSEDLGRLLVMTNAEKVWRYDDRGDYWLLDRETGELWQLGGEGVPPSSMKFAKFSPDGTRVAWVRDAVVWVQDLATRDIVQVSEDAGPELINGIMSWAYEEEFQIRDGFRWSPDGESIAYWQFDTSGVRDFVLINNTDELYPTLTNIPYPKVGETVSAASVGVAPASGGATVWAELPGDPRQMYIPRMDWADNSEQLLVQHLNRKQDTNTLYYVDAATGDAVPFFVEHDEDYVDDVFDVTWFADGESFLWISERSGWRHLYRVSRDGATVTDLTPGEFDVVEPAGVEGDSVFFIAAPENVNQRYLYRAAADGAAAIERLTPADYAGWNGYDLSPDAAYAIHTHSAFDSPPQYRLVALPEHRVTHVLEDNAALIEKMAALALGETEFFRVAARDGLELDGFIMRPPGFDPSRKYPIVFYVYGEVAGQTVRDAWGGDRQLWHRLLTQRGFVVASIDNRGTRSPRGREWRKSVYGAVGILASRDQSDALAAMAGRWPWVDADRVGIWGHSGGGSMTLNMLFRYPDQYHAGVSQAPVPDQRLYDAIYQERYSGLLEEYAENYEAASPISHAANLEGELLLVHGTGDDNVHYQGSEKLINELVRHNKQFRFMAYPNRSHSLDEGEGTELHLHTMKTNFFVEHLAP